MKIIILLLFFFIFPFSIVFAQEQSESNEGSVEFGAIIFAISASIIGSFIGGTILGSFISKHNEDKRQKKELDVIPITVFTTT